MSLDSAPQTQSSESEDITRILSLGGSLQDWESAKFKLSSLDKNFVDTPEFLNQYNTIANQLAEQGNITSLAELFILFGVEFTDKVTFDILRDNLPLAPFESAVEDAIKSPSNVEATDHLYRIAIMLKDLGGIKDNIVYSVDEILRAKNVSESTYLKIHDLVSKI